MYVLEVQKLLDSGKYLHLGYMDKIFIDKYEASMYYDNHNKHMRKLHAFYTYRSDWDPDTKLRYLIRDYSGEQLTISPF